MLLRRRFDENTSVPVAFVGVGDYMVGYVPVGSYDWVITETNHVLNNVKWAVDKYVAVGNNVTAYSLDGVNWTFNQRNEGYNYSKFDLDYNGKLVAIISNGIYPDGKILISEDGINWNIIDVYRELSRSVTVGYNKQVYDFEIFTSNSASFYYTENGDRTTWTNSGNVLPSPTTFYDLTYGYGYMLGIASSGKVYFSPGSSTTVPPWGEISTGLNLNRVAYYHTYFFLCGVNCVAAIDQTPVWSGNFVEINDAEFTGIAYTRSGGYAMAVGKNGVSAYFETLWDLTTYTRNDILPKKNFNDITSFVYS